MFWSWNGATRTTRSPVYYKTEWIRHLAKESMASNVVNWEMSSVVLKRNNRITIELFFERRK